MASERDTMVQYIKVEILDMTKKSLAKQPLDEADDKKITALARSIESHLIRCAPSMEAYLDQSTLKTRIQLAANRIHSMVRDRDTEGSRQVLDYGKKRSTMLRVKLGAALFAEMDAVVVAIRKIRTTNTTWAIMFNSEAPSAEDKDLPASQSMPKELAKIYFGTRLVEAERYLSAKTVSLEPERLSTFNWENLIREAQENLAAFLKVEEVLKKTNPELKCQGRMCCFNFCA